MTIEIKPAEVIGASIGDRVTWSHGRYPGAARYHGTLIGVATDDEHSLLVIEDDNGETRRVSPETARVTPKKYVLGDKVGAEAADALPDGALVSDMGMLPLFKMKGDWYVIDPEMGTYQVPLAGNRTIVWLPTKYRTS